MKRITQLLVLMALIVSLAVPTVSAGEHPKAGTEHPTAGSAHSFEAAKDNAIKAYEKAVQAANELAGEKKVAALNQLKAGIAGVSTDVVDKEAVKSKISAIKSQVSKSKPKDHPAH